MRAAAHPAPKAGVSRAACPQGRVQGRGSPTGPPVRSASAYREGLPLGRKCREEWRHCTYTANVRSMMRTDYDCIFFTARKPAAEGKS